MQQYYAQVRERREQATRRNQALQRDVRQAYTSVLSVAVDTSKLETLKMEYQLSVASQYQEWLSYSASIRAQGRGLPAPTAGQTTIPPLTELPKTTSSSTSSSQIPPPLSTSKHLTLLHSTATPHRLTENLTESHSQRSRVPPQPPPSAAIVADQIPTHTDCSSHPRPQNAMSLEVSKPSLPPKLAPTLSYREKQQSRPEPGSDLRLRHRQEQALPSSEKEHLHELVSASGNQPVGQSSISAGCDDGKGGMDEGVSEKSVGTAATKCSEGGESYQENEKVADGESGVLVVKEGTSVADRSSTTPGRVTTGDLEEDQSVGSCVSNSGDSLPLPQDTPSQREGGQQSNKESTSVSTDSVGDGELSVDVEKSSFNQDRVLATEHTAPLPRAENETDAYASFLRSVKQTTVAAAAPLLDSDSEGVEDVVSGHQEKEPSASPPTTSAGGRVLGTKNKSETEKKEDGELDASGSEDSQPRHTSSYVPSVMERTQSAESKTLQKRLGFWGSESSLTASEIEAPTAEDDQGDFDFYM